MIRVATFNVQNLFSRPRVFNFLNNRNGDKKLEIIAQLQDEFEKDVYDKPKIISLYKQVKSFIKFNVIKSSIGFRIISRGAVVPNGRGDWQGFIELTREKFGDSTQKNIQKIIKEVDADILAVVEAESRPTLKQFNSEVLASMYPYHMLIDGNDTRGIDVGLYSRYPLGNIQTHIFDKKRGKNIFSRDCLEIDVKTSDGEKISLLINHFKSKSGRNQSASDARRKSQATRVSKILDSYRLRNDYVVVLGDLNDTPDSNTLSPLTNITDLHDTLELQFNDPKDRWTYHYRGENQQIDYLLISSKLKSKFKQAGVERRGIANLRRFSNGRERSFTSVTNWRNQASDHAAIWADFDL